MKARKLPSGNYNTDVNYYEVYGKRKQKSFTAKTERAERKYPRRRSNRMQ